MLLAVLFMLFAELGQKQWPFPSSADLAQASLSQVEKGEVRGPDAVPALLSAKPGLLPRGLPGSAPDLPQAGTPASLPQGAQPLFAALAPAAADGTALHLSGHLSSRFPIGPPA
ncbi:hypothetical protein [Telmatospirillum sp. J64-1]|uniref:hypothetical protein n=1 Tax=Telmatospirillum sp. J64-1 TaxID=2502183 RepID=UPI00115E6B78|nr:hypothetical protein [Telmatospirillum sp. J64-1]